MAIETVGAVIRPYREQDEASLLKLWEEVFPGEPAWNDPHASIRRKLKCQREFFLVVDLAGKIIGSAMAGFDGYRGWVYYVAVSPQYQRLSLGSALMKRIEAILGEIDCPQLNLLVRYCSVEVSAFYRKLGFEVEPKLCMSKRLALS